MTEVIARATDVDIRPPRPRRTRCESTAQIVRIRRRADSQSPRTASVECELSSTPNHRFGRPVRGSDWGLCRGSRKGTRDASLCLDDDPALGRAVGRRRGVARGRFALITSDPATDTADRLRALADERRLDPARWSLLRGGAGDVRAVATVLGVQYSRVDATTITHANAIPVLDAEGAVSHQLEGLEATRRRRRPAPRGAGAVTAAPAGTDAFPTQRRPPGRRGPRSDGDRP